MMRLSGSVKFFCALGTGSGVGGAAGLPGFLRPSAWRFASASARALVSASAAALASASSSAFAARIFAARFCLSATQSGNSSPRFVATVELVFFRVGHLGGIKPLLNLGFELLRPSLHASIRHRLVLGGIGFDLRAVERHMPELHQTRLITQHQNLRE